MRERGSGAGYTMGTGLGLYAKGLDGATGSMRCLLFGFDAIVVILLGSRLVMMSGNPET
jgi:hypothetical protein